MFTIARSLFRLAAVLPLAAAFQPGAQAQCLTCVQNLLLPSSAKVSFGSGGATAIFAATVSGVSGTYDLGNAVYPAWCGDTSTLSAPGSVTGQVFYSTYNLPAAYQNPNWQRVNWALNNKPSGATPVDIQNVVWLLLKGAVNPKNPPVTPLATAFYNQALAVGGFVPKSGETVAIFMPRPGMEPFKQQNMILEMKVPDFGRIGDLVWQDLNRDGIQTPGEPGINGVLVRLEDGVGNVLATQTTHTQGAQDGSYLFDNLPAGSYTVEYDASTVPAVMTATYAGQGAAATDSNSNPFTVNLPARGSELTIDFGFYTPCTGRIGDFVWNDVNRNGIQDAGELGIQGVKLTLTTAGGLPVGSPVTTGSTGAYQFTGVCSGAYQVAVDESTVPAGYTATPANAPVSNANNDSNGNPAANVVLSTDSSIDTSIDFGYAAACTGMIGNFAWHDQNRNGIQDAGEPGLNGVVLKLMQGSTQVAVTTTAGNGSYQFSGVCNGGYSVVVDTTPGGYTPTAAGAPGSNPGNDSNASPAAVSLPVNGSDQTIDFGFTGACSGIIGDFVWNDLNRNGIQDAGEPGIPNVTVNLRNASDNALIAFTTTGINGAYSFGARCTGDYKVEVVPPAGYAASAANALGSAASNDANPNPASVSLSSDLSQDLTIDFGYYLGSLGDRIWFDINGDKLQDAAETGLTGWTVTISGASLPPLYPAAQTTGPNGIYAFTGLPAGTYTVCATPMAGYAQTYDLTSPLDNCATRVLAAGENATDVDFGYTVLYSLGDRVWADANGNTAQDSGEVGIDNVTVQVTNSAGTVVGTAVTAGGGNYTVGNLPAGTYTVCVVSSTLPPLYTQTYDLTAPLDNCAAVTLGPGRTDVDFGYRPPSQSGSGAFTTYTQGGWGSKPSGHNPGWVLATNFSTIYPSGVTIGVSGGGGRLHLKFTSASAITNFLPAGGTAKALTASATDPTTSTAGVFAGQTLALRLSVDFSNAGITRAGLAALKVKSGVLAGQTVAQVLALANTVLGGGAIPSGLTVSALNDVLDSINNNFDNGTTDKGYLQ